MTTKKKCMELAAEHQIEISYSKNRYGWECDLYIPNGYTLEDYRGARTGLTFSGVDTAKKFWQSVYEDLQTCISYKPWFKVPDDWK
jgi:hypothetical protein